MGKLEHLQKYDVVLMFENTSEQSIIEQSKEQPDKKLSPTYVTESDNWREVKPVQPYKK